MSAVSSQSAVHILSVGQMGPDKPVELVCTTCRVTIEQFAVDPQTRMTALSMMAIVAKAVESFRVHAGVAGKCGHFITDHVIAKDK